MAEFLMNSWINLLPPLLASVLPIVGLAAGLLGGWALAALHQRRANRSALRGIAPELALELSRDERLDQMHAAEVELSKAEMRLNELNATVAATRQQLDDAEEEYDRLLVAVDERQSVVVETRGNLNAMRQNLDARRDQRNRMLNDVDRSIEEMDMLKQMRDSYQVKINRLTQQVQWQDAELRMLRQTVKVRTSEIDEARALLEQRDAELRVTQRQRQQREIDIAHARQLLAQKDDEFRRQMGAASADAALPAEPPPPLSLPPRRVDVTPRQPPALPKTTVPEKPAPSVRSYVTDELDDDLTVIPRLSSYYAEQFRRSGVKSLRQLAALTPDQARAMLDIPGHHTPNIEGWIKAAKKLTRKRRGESAT